MGRAAGDLATYCEDLAKAACEASRRLGVASGHVKNDALRRAAGALRDRRQEILSANGKDMEAAPGYGLSSAAVDRLRLDDTRVEGMATAMEGWPPCPTRWAR